VSHAASSVEDGDWWMPHAMLAAFAMLVAAILRLLFGWSAPLHAWIAMAGPAMAALAAHAAWRAARCARLRQWRHAGLASLLVVALGVATLAMLGAGRSHRIDGVVLIDAPLDHREDAR
jgi:chromate transport protein ChrA